jgi:putative FmdB family regulatory protein
MPIYEYRCTNDHRFEVLQRFSDDAITECEVCGAPAVRVLHPVAIHFKGSGFYNTDYGKGKKKASEGRSEGGGESKSGSEGSSSSSGDSKKSDSSGGSSSSGDKKKAAEG